MSGFKGGDHGQRNQISGRGLDAGFHKITDIHIIENGGTLRGFVKPIRFARVFQEINWDVQWNFVFKRTIPLFWIPAQTITFLLPEEFRVLFAAFLGIVLGVLLAVAARS